MMHAQPGKPAIIQAELILKEKIYINSHYIRIILTGEEVPIFAETTIGVNNKIFIPPAGVDKVYFPHFDAGKKVWNHPENVRPFIRTYTHRGIDLERNEMIIDFVAHGDEGPASAWAIHSKPGDKLGVAMKAKTITLFPQVDWYLLVADATGIPVISAILEKLPETAVGVAFIEVIGRDEEQVFKAPANVQINWLHHLLPGENTVLTDAVRGLKFPDHNSHFGYVAAEYKTVQDVRQYLRKERSWSVEQLDAFAYWTHGLTEGASGIKKNIST